MMDNGGTNRKTYLTGELAELIGATLRGDAEIQITGLGTLEDAGPGQLTFVTSARYSPLVSQCAASAIIVPPSLKDFDRTILICEQPYLGLARVAQLFAELPFLPAGVHERAYVGHGSELGSEVSVGPLAHIGWNCVIGESSRIYGGAYVGNGVCVGRNCLIYPGATILDGCRLGDRVIIHSGTVIGSDGFGFARDDQGHHIKIPQVGIVQVDDDVEIGANCCVDRATFGKTWIQRGTKIDNLVQIGHNVVVGENSILVSQVGISGSTRLGKHVVLAGQVGVVGHIEIGDRVRIGAKSGVNRSVKAGEDVVGIPAMPHRQWRKTIVNLMHLSELNEELRKLKTKVQKLEESLGGD